tara:strand:- start:3040 stop:3300 length:261 start_codon:yes stop_codon:yes gene_type:complete
MIHTSYTVGITTGQFLALEVATTDQLEWIKNAVDAKALNATRRIVQKYTTYKVDKGESITAIGSTAIIQAAIDENIVYKMGTEESI